MTQPPEPPRAPDGMRFNSPPGWPAPPAGWVPPPGFQPDPSWPTAPPGWQWWAPVEPSGGLGPGSGWPGPDDTAQLGDTERLSETQAFGGPAFGAPRSPPAYVGPPGQQVYGGPAGPPPVGPPSFGDQPPAGEPRSWVARHVLLTVALVVVVLLVLGGVATAGVLFVSNRGDDKLVAAGKSADPSRNSEPEPSAQPSPSAPADSDSPEHKAACDKAAAASSKAVALITALSTKSQTNSAIIAAIPPIQRDLDAVAGTTSGALARELQEYSKALGALRTDLQQGKDPSAAAAKVLIYSIILKAECAN